MPDNFESLPPVPVPATVADLLAHRKSMQAKSLNDEVDDIFLRLWEVPKFRDLFAAIHPSQTIEGSFSADDYVAAEMVREYAKEHHFPIASNTKLAAIIFSLHVVCRRYEQGRSQRRNMVKGQRVDMAAEAAN
jgi:hypothetical protein